MSDRTKAHEKPEHNRDCYWDYNEGKAGAALPRISLYSVNQLFILINKSFLFMAGDFVLSTLIKAILYISID